MHFRLDKLRMIFYIFGMKEKSLNLGKTKRADIRSISEVYFGYNAKSEVYPQFTADINKISKMPSALRKHAKR